MEDGIHDIQGGKKFDFAEVLLKKPEIPREDIRLLQRFLCEKDLLYEFNIATSVFGDMMIRNRCDGIYTIFSQVLDLFIGYFIAEDGTYSSDLHRIISSYINKLLKRVEVLNEWDMFYKKHNTERILKEWKEICNIVLSLMPLKSYVSAAPNGNPILVTKDTPKSLLTILKSNNKLLPIYIDSMTHYSLLNGFEKMYELKIN